MGPNPVVAKPLGYVRFSSRWRHLLLRLTGPIRAMSGLMHCDRLSEALPNDLILNRVIGSWSGVLRSSFSSGHGQFSQRISNPALQAHYCDWMIMRPTVHHSI
jgi:hypothetical protein